MPMPNQSQDYKKLKLLGQGTYGKAFLVERKSDGVKCVIKQIEMAHMTEDERKEAQKEANILQILNHHNIIKYHEQYKTKKGRLCIVMDYAEGGDLNQVITKARSNIPEEQILNWLLQLSLALNYVHNKNIIHRDIKAQNVFLSSNNIVKLADFGIARILSCTKDKAQTFIGTPYYLAPELVDSKPYSTKADIWSLGVLIYHLCALKPPFEAENIPGLMLKISRGYYPPIPQIYSKELRYLINEMLTVDPNQRPSALQILEKPLIKSRAMSLMSETIALQVQKDTDDQTEERQQPQVQLQQQQQKEKKQQQIPIIDNDRRFGFKDINKNSNISNIPQRFYSPQHNMDQRNLGFNNNNVDKQSYHDLPNINGDDISNRPKSKMEALRLFKAQDEYFKQNNSNNNNQQGNQEGKRQLNRVESMNEFSNNNSNNINNNLQKKNGLVKQPSFQPNSQQENNLQQQGISNANFPKKSFRVHSPVHHKMPSPTNRFTENKNIQQNSNYNNPSSAHHNQNFSSVNENINSNYEFQYNNKNNGYDQQQFQNAQKGPVSNNYLMANNNQSNVNIQNNNNINSERQNNQIDQKFQNNANNNAQPQQNRVGSPGTRLPHLNYQPPPAKVKHGQNFSVMDNVPQTPQTNQRRNLEKIQKPSILNNKNEIASPKFNQRPPSALIGFGNYNNLQKRPIGMINQECHSPNANINKLNQIPSKNQQQFFSDQGNNSDQIQQQQNNHISNMREQLQSANPTNYQIKMNKLQQPNLLNIQQQITQQQNISSNQQQQSTKETQKSEESSESSQDDQQMGSQNQLGKNNQINIQNQQQNQQQKKFVIKKGGLQGLQPGQQQNQLLPIPHSVQNHVSSAHRVSSQPSEDHFNQPPSQLVNFNTQPSLLNSQNIQLLCIDSDSSQRDTPKNVSDNITQTTVNSSIINTQLLKKSDFSMNSATQASQYEITQAIKSNLPQSGFEEIKTAKKNIHSIKQISSADNIDNTESQFKASSSTSSQNSQPNKILQSKNLIQNVSKQEFSEIKGKRKDSQSDEDIRIFDSVDSQKSVKSPTNITNIAAPQSHFSQSGSNNQLSSNFQSKNKLTASEDIDSNKRQGNLPISASILNADNDKETKVERKLIVKLPLPFQENQLKQKEKRKNKNNEISPEVKVDNEEQETDLEKMLNELNQMLTGNFDEQIQNLYTNGFELDTIEDKDDYLDEEEFGSNNNYNNYGSSPSNNLGNNQNNKMQLNFVQSNIPNNISCIGPPQGFIQNKNKLHNSGNHNSNNNLGSNQNLSSNNNLSVVSKAIATSNTNQSEIHPNSEDRVKQLRHSLEKEIGTMHFSKVYKMAVVSLSSLQQPLESSEFFQNLKVMFPSCNNQEIQRYTTLFHTLVMLEQD